MQNAFARCSCDKEVQVTVSYDSAKRVPKAYQGSRFVVNMCLNIKEQKKPFQNFPLSHSNWDIILSA